MFSYMDKFESRIAYGSGGGSGGGGGGGGGGGSRVTNANYEDAGTAIGSFGGAVIGGAATRSNIGAAAGASAGGYIGGKVGGSINPKERDRKPAGNGSVYTNNPPGRHQSNSGPN